MDEQLNAPITTAQSQASGRLKVDTGGISKMRKRKQILRRELRNI